MKAKSGDAAFAARASAVHAALTANFPLFGKP